MHSVKLTVFIDDRADLDMEVHVVAPDTAAGARAPAPAPLRLVPEPGTTLDDEYTLGGYAGI